MQRGQGLNLVLLGPPGVGKGTQARRLGERYKIPQISTGDILRARKDEKSLIGEEVRNTMGRGKLVPDELVISLVEERLEGDDCHYGFVLDGFPRNVAQADALDRVLEEKKKELSGVISLEVASEELVRRLLGRRVCRKCGANYNLELSSPQKPGVCDQCGGELGKREDDKEEVIRARLKVYEEETAPLISYYSRKKTLLPVNGQGTVDEIFARIIRVLEKENGDLKVRA